MCASDARLVAFIFASTHAFQDPVGKVLFLVPLFPSYHGTPHDGQQSSSSSSHEVVMCAYCLCVLRVCCVVLTLVCAVICAREGAPVNGCVHTQRITSRTRESKTTNRGVKWRTCPALRDYDFMTSFQRKVALGRSPNQNQTVKL